MSRCYSVIARETLVFPPRWKRHLIEDGICKRCLQPAFVKIAAVTTPPSMSFTLNLGATDRIRQIDDAPVIE